MAVEADRGEEMSPASLQSPMKKQASATCTLHFYYSLYGDGRFYICTWMNAKMLNKKKSSIFLK